MNVVDTAFDQLISDIQSNINGENTGSGFYAVHCPMCKNKNQTQKKGGFKFENDQIGYSCFRGSCEANTVYTKGEKVPRKFRDLMDAIGVTVPIQLRANAKKKFSKVEDLDDRFEKNIYKTLQMPDEFSTEISDYWIEYLIDRRIAYPEFDFRESMEGPYKGCLVVPHYFFDKLIGWDYISKKSKNYITDSKSSESMLFLPNKVIPKRPIIVEGLMDALCFPNTVGAKHANITPKQAYHLRHSKPIALPDRSSSKLYESAKYYGWDVCIPMWKEKDLNAVVQNKGVLVAARMIYDGVMPIGNKSELMYRRWVNL